MKIFVSWSGELSRKIAEVLKKWIPCIIQSVDVFFSSEDIEKGDNWDRVITEKLAECKYGIICLSPENINAPWVHFEAGAIAKTLDSRVTTLMIKLKPSDIKGPLSRYQATKFERDDFYQLIVSINGAIESPLDNKILEHTFNAMWGMLEAEINEIISKYSLNNGLQKKSKEEIENSPIEEILQLLRKQNSLLANPENLLPVEYMQHMQSLFFERSQELHMKEDNLENELLLYAKRLIFNIRTLLRDGDVREYLKMLEVEELIRILRRYGKYRNNRYMYNEARELERILYTCLKEEEISVTVQK